MLGDGQLFENSIFEETNAHVIRVVLAVYLCLSIIVLLNMLIAMMNNTFVDVTVVRKSLWYIETVNSISWVTDVVLVSCCATPIFRCLSSGIGKQPKPEQPEDSFQKICSRIDALESSLEDIRVKLDRLVPAK